MNASLQAHKVETMLTQDGTLTLEQLPFRAGQAVEVIVLPTPFSPPSQGLYSLRGTPVQYIRPTEPIADEDWDAGQ